MCVCVCARARGMADRADRGGEGRAGPAEGPATGRRRLGRAADQPAAPVGRDSGWAAYAGRGIYGSAPAGVPPDSRGQPPSSLVGMDKAAPRTARGISGYG